MANVLNGTTYIITFEVGTGGDLNKIISLIKSYGTWATITPNTWVVFAVGEKATQIRDKMIPFIGISGRVFVIKSGYESAWRNPIATSEWLKKYLAN